MPNPATATSPLLSSPAFTPKGWPVVQPELLMGYVDRVMVVRIGPAFAEPAFAHYLREWERAVEARPAGSAIFAMYDMPAWPGLTAVQRKSWAGMLSRHQEILRATTRGMVLATPSSLTRGGARALFWLAPPPYPYAVVETTRAAFDYIAGRGGPPAAPAHEAYEELVRRHWVAGDA
jgi:hypothetical protein